MASANYPACYAITRNFEGGNDDDPRDPGGRTSRGVIQREYDTYRDRKSLPRKDVWTASEQEIADIYRTNYWNAVSGDRWPAGPDLVVWDCAVNSGPGRSKIFATSALGIAGAWDTLAVTCDNSDKVKFVKAACAARQAFLSHLSTFTTFGRGWTRRVAGIEANGVKMALATAGVQPESVQRELQKESGAAATASKKTGAGAAAPTAAGGVTTQHPGWGFDWTTAGKVAVICVAICLAIYLIRRAAMHNDRAKAYLEVIKETVL